MCSVLIRISPPLFILLSFNSAIVRALCRCKHRFASSFGPRENRRSAQNSQTATELDALMLNRATMSYFADLENSQKWLRSEPQGSRRHRARTWVTLRTHTWVTLSSHYVRSRLG